jgi:hypothetical protein
MVRLALFVMLVWTAASVPLAVLVGAVLGSLDRKVVPARVVVRSHDPVIDLSSR